MMRSRAIRRRRGWLSSRSDWSRSSARTLALVYALGHLPATITSVGLLAQVPLTALLAMALLREPLSAAQVAGGVIVLAGIYVVNRGEGKATPLSE